MTGAPLEQCVGDVRSFADEHWGRSPLLHRAGRDAFSGLLELGDVDRLVTETLLRMPAFRLVKDGETLDPKSYTQTVRIGGQPLERTARADKVADAFAGGATIVLQALHRQTGEIARLCRGLELALTHPVQANAYITPPSSRGFAIHHDTHDVFVIQTHGSKAWRVYGPVVELAGPDQPWKGEEAGEPILEAELTPGDVLYIPRGFPHDADARKGISVHVTVGITAATWLDLWRDVMKRASEHRPFRDPLPVGFAAEPESLSDELEVRTKELHAWLDEAVGEGTIAEAAERFWRTRRPLASGRLVDLERADSLDATTPVRRRTEGVFRLSIEDDRAVVLLGLRELRLPAYCEAALRFVAAATGTFAARDLPGLADDSSRLVLVRRLVREGALEVVIGAD